MSLPKKPRTRTYVVVRYDPSAPEPQLQFTAEEVVESPDLAQAEVERLSALSKGTRVRYFAQPARLHRPDAPIGSAATKSPAIDEALDELRARLGDVFDVVDHWPADPYAIAVRARRSPARLAYISAYEKPNGLFDVHLERTPDPAAGSAYADVGYFTDVDMNRLAAIVARHFRAPSAPGPPAE